MPTTFRPCAPDQSFLFPQSPRDWLPEGHLAFFVADSVAALDLHALRGVGPTQSTVRPADDGDRAVVRVCHRDVLVASDRAKTGRGCGVSRAGRGQLSRAPHDRRLSAAALGELPSAVRAGRTDRARSGRGAARRAGGGWDEGQGQCEQAQGDELPAELQRREERLAKIAAAKARLEARQADEDRQKGRTPDDGRKSRGHKPFARDFGVPPDNAQDNFTDPESRIMKTSYGFDQCYNGQLAVDEATQLIVATGLTNCAADNAELLPLIDQAQGTLGEPPP